MESYPEDHREKAPTLKDITEAFETLEKENPQEAARAIGEAWFRATWDTREHKYPDDSNFSHQMKVLQAVKPFQAKLARNPELFELFLQGMTKQIGIQRSLVRTFSKS